jgi:hypothetical protein
MVCTMVRHSIRAIVVLTLLAGVGGCYGPDYASTYGYPTYGYSPYSYGFPVYARGYTPNFVVHHPWEEHHEVGHHEIFFHEPVQAPRPAARSGGSHGEHGGETHEGGHR